VFTSTWTGPGRIDVCERPHHLLLTMEPGTEEEGQIEAWLTAEGGKTRLVVDQRGLPLKGLAFYGSGIQAHLEDLARSLAADAADAAEDARTWSEQTPEPSWHERWTELTPAYQEMVID